MGRVTVRMATELRWVCTGCGAAFPISGPADDLHGENTAAEHEKTCGSDVRIAGAPAWIEYEVEPPLGPG